MYCRDKCDKEKIKQGLCFCRDEEGLNEEGDLDIEEHIYNLAKINKKLNNIEDGEGEKRKNGKKK